MYWIFGTCCTLSVFFPLSLSSKCRLFHNATFFGSCIIRILHTGCAKIWISNSSAKRLKLIFSIPKSLSRVLQGYTRRTFSASGQDPWPGHATWQPAATSQSTGMQNNPHPQERLHHRDIRQHVQPSPPDCSSPHIHRYLSELGQTPHRQVTGCTHSIPSY
jgi:hypothetical protein